MTKDSTLKLRVTDEEDLAVVSTLLQDSVIAIQETAFLAGERQFVFVANRFCWEDAARERSLEGTAIYERVNCGVCFENVISVRQRGLVQERKDQIVALLVIEAVNGMIDLKFSAGVVIRLEVDQILCHVQDLDEPWPTQRRPTHPMDGSAS